VELEPVYSASVLLAMAGARSALERERRRLMLWCEERRGSRGHYIGLVLLRRRDISVQY